MLCCLYVCLVSHDFYPGICNAIQVDGVLTATYSLSPSPIKHRKEKRAGQGKTRHRQKIILDMDMCEGIDTASLPKLASYS
jgi:hypothetical protein